MIKKVVPRDTAPQTPVTSIIRRHIKEGCEAEFDAWSDSIGRACSQFAGHLGTQRIRPLDPRGEHVTIISFDKYENYQTWEESGERSRLLDRVKPLTEGRPSREQIEGLNHWLLPGTGKARAWPPDFRMVLVAFLAIWPIVHFVRPALAPYLPEHPLLASISATAIISLIMGYLSLPLMVRIFRRWLR